MPIYHVVLYKLRPGTTTGQIDEFKKAGEAMVGQLPGLATLRCGPPLQVTSHRAKGYDLGLVAQLESLEDVKAAAEHPAHLRWHSIREVIVEDVLAFDLEF